MATIPEPILDKVRALLAKAEDPSVTEPEALAYTAKANEWMARHSIDTAMLDARQGRTTGPTFQTFTITGARLHEKVLLLGQIGLAVRCRSLRTAARNRTIAVTMYGYPTDLERTEVLYTSLLVQMVNGLETVDTPQGVDTRRFRRAWLAGYATRVHERLSDIEQSAQQDTTPERDQTTTLVLHDRDKAIEALIRKHNPRIAKDKSAPVNPTGYQAGRTAADQADLGQTRVTSTRPAISA